MSDPVNNDAALAAAAKRTDEAKLRWYEGDIPDGSARIKELEAALEFVTGVLVQAHVSDISEREYQAAIDVAKAALASDAEQGPIPGTTFLPPGAPTPPPGKLIGGYSAPDAEQENA